MLVFEGSYAPADFQVRSARLRSWRLDLIDASHLTAKAGESNAGSENSTAPPHRSRLPSDCAHLDSYLGISYSLQFSAPWNVALHEAASERATQFVDPFGSQTASIFNGWCWLVGW